MKVLLIDNFDSFTFNLYQYLSELGAKVTVLRNNEITVQDIVQQRFSHIVISPGPSTPNDAGISLEVIKSLAGKLPILGVCLGHQAIGQAFGGQVIRAPRLMHGKVSPIKHTRKGVFKKIPQNFTATRYHSLIVEKKSLPKTLEITATTSDGVIMGLRHVSYAIEGVQFHPESIMTQNGQKILRNFLSYRSGIWKN